MFWKSKPWHDAPTNLPGVSYPRERQDRCSLPIRISNLYFQPRILKVNSLIFLDSNRLFKVAYTSFTPPCGNDHSKVFLARSMRPYTTYFTPP